MTRRGLLLALAAAWVLATWTTSAKAQFAYTEDFKNNTAAGWVLDPAGNSAIGPVLTGGTAPRSGDPEMGDTYIDPAGSGWLRLTNATTNLHNAVYFDTPVPSAGNSVTIDFGLNLWGGNNFNNTGADGFTFFLYDASKEFVVGANGGSMGYAQKVGTANDDHAGLNGGWVGVAFDPYGNFSVAGEGRVGGTGSLQANSIAVRGPGDGNTGYNYLAGTGNRDYTDTGGATTLDGGDGTVPALPYTLAYPTATERPNQSTQYRNVSITFDENSQLTVSIQFGEDGLWYDVLDVDLSSFVRPEQLKMGFAAGTGSGTIVAEIGGLLSVTATAGSGNFVWDNGEGASFKVWGTGADDPLNWAGNTNPTLKSNVLFNSAYISTAQAIDVTGSDKVVKNVYFSGAHAYTLTTSDQRMLIFDSDSVGVPTSINVTNDAGGNASHTIGLDVLMNKNLEVNNNIANVFTISGNIDTNGNTLTSKGVGATALTGVISGSGGLVKSDSGTTTISGAAANTYTGTTVINGGTLQIEKAAALGSTAAGTTVNNGGTLALGGSGTSFAAEGLTLNGTGVGSNGALLNAAGNNTWTGTVGLASDSNVGVATGTTLTVSGVVSGAAGNDLTKVGSGTLVLSGTNTYSGATNINAGTLRISADTNLGSAPGSVTADQLTLNGGTLNTTATLTLNANRGVTLNTPGGGTFDTNAGTTLTYNGIIAGAGDLNKAGTGTFTLGGANTYGGATNINAGTLSLGTANVLPNGTAVTVASGATFNVNGQTETIASLAGTGATTLGSGTLTIGSGDASSSFAGVISGSGGVTKTGAGDLIFTGANTFTGTLQADAGSVTLGASNTLANTATLALNGGTLAVGGNFSDTIGSLSLLSSSIIDFGSHTSTLTFSNVSRTAGTLTINNWAGDPFGAGASQLIFSSETDYTAFGDTNINFTGWGSGSTRLASGEIVPNTGGTIYTYALTGGGNWNVDNNWSDNSQPAGSDPGTFASVTGDTAILGSAATGPATVSLGGANRTLGYLVFNSSQNYTVSGNSLNFNVSSGLAQITNSGSGAQTIASGVRLNDALNVLNNGSGGLTISGITSNASGTNSVTVGGTGNTTISGDLNMGGGSLTKTGSGTLTLTMADSDYTGKTIINEGVLAISNEAQLGNNPGASVADQLTLNGGTLRTQTSAVTINDSNREIFIGANGGTFDTVTNLTVANTNVLSGSGTLTKDGSGILQLQAANTHTGNIVVNAGTVRTSSGTSFGDSALVTLNNASTWQTDSSETVGNIAGTGNITFGGSNTLTFGDATNRTLSGVISDGTFTGILTKQGVGTVTLSGANTYDGATNITQGALNIQSATGLGSTTGGTVVSTGASLQIQHGTGITIGAEALTLSGGGLDNNGALRNVAGANSLAGNITLNAAAEIQSDAGTLTLSGGISSANLGLTLDGAGNVAASGVIGLGTGTLTKDGTGYATLSGNNTYTGATSINAGTVEIQHASGLGTNAAGTTIANGATLALSGGISSAEGLTVSGQGVDSLGAVRSLGGSNTLTGTIALNAESHFGVATGSTLTTTGVVSGGFGLTKTGTGTMVLDGSAANTYGGTTAVSAGILEIRRSDSLGSTNATTIADGATLRLNGAGLSVAENFTVTGSGVSAGGAIQNTGGDNTLTGAITMTGNSVVSATTGTNLTINGVLASSPNPFNLVKDGAGTVTLGNAANTYAGSTTVRNGTLVVTADAPAGSNGALGNASSTVQLGDASSTGPVALLAGGSGGVDIGRQISVNNQGTGTTLGGTNTSGTNTFTGNVTLAKDVTLTAASGGTVAFSGIVAGTGAVAKTGDGTVVLSGANTYAGATTVSAGTLQAANAAALGSTAAGTTVASGATLSLSGDIALASGESLSLAGSGVSAAVGALNNLSGTNSVAGAVTLAGNTTIGSTAGTLTISGAIGETGGARSLITEGAGDVAFTGAGSFTGNVTIDGTGTVTLAAGGGQAFGGVADITINTGATLALGASDQINDSANLILSGGRFSTGGFSETMRQLSQTTASAIDFLNDGGTLAFNGGGSVNGLGTLTGTLTIDNWAGSLSGSGGEQFVVYSTGGAPVVTGITFTDWGTATTVARGDLGSGYYEIVPTLTGTQWNVDSATVQNWGTAANWSPGTVPNSTNAIAILGNTVGSPPLDNNVTISMQTTNRTVGKLIFENGANRSYTVGNGTTGRLDFNVTNGGQGQIIVNDDGAHTIAASSRYNDNMLITNNSDAATGLTLSGAISLRDGDGNAGTGTNLTTFNGDGRTVVSGVISQSGTTGSILKTGSGTLVLSGTNSYTGTTTLRNGTLELAGNAPSGSSGNLGTATSAVVINDASTTAGMSTTLLMTDADGGSTVARALTVNNYGDTTTLGGTNTAGTNTFSGDVTLNKDVDLTAATGGTVAFSGVLSGNGGIEKIDAGTVTLSGTGTNTFAGDVTVTAGTLNINKTGGANRALGDNADVTVAGGASLVFAGGQSETIGSLAGAGSLDNSNAGAITLTTGGNGATTLFSGNITDTGGSLSLAKNGSGTMTLSGANAYDGTTSVTAGTLIAASNTALGTATGGTTVSQDATLGLQGGITVTGESLSLAAKAAANIASVANLAGNNTLTGNISLTGGTAGDDVKLDAAAGTQLTLSGAISEATNAKDISKSGTGTLVLSGTNTYTGETSVAAGTLVVSNSAALGSANANPALDNTFVQIGATLAFDHTTGVTLGSGEDLTLYSTASPTAPSLKNIAGSNTIQGNVALSGGVNTGVIIDTNAGTLDLAGVVSNGVNANFLTKTGAGTLTLSGTSANTYGGATNVNNGTLLLNKTAGLNAVGPGNLNIGDSIGSTSPASAIVRLSASDQINNATAVTIATDGKLDLQGNSDAIGSLTMAGGSVTATGSGTLTLGGNLTFNGIGTSTAAITANVDLGGNRIVQVGNNAVSTATDRDLTINGVISGTGSSFTKTDLGTLELTGAANTFTGDFQITDGTVVLNKTAVAGVKGNATGVGNANVTIGDSIRGANTAIMEVSGDGLASGQTSDQIANSATLTVNSDGKFLLSRTGGGTDDFTETIGALAGSGNVDLGYYSLIAGGNNASTSFSGTLAGQSSALFTKEGSGTLTIDSNLGFGGDLDLTGGALAFNMDNAFNGAVNVFAGTTLKLSDADLSIANLNFVGSGTITLDFSGTSTLNVTNLTIAAGITVNVINWTDATDYFFAQNWSGAVFNTHDVAPVNQVVFATFDPADTVWQGYDNQITPVPEPSTYGAMLLGAMGALLGYRRWRKTKSQNAAAAKQ